MGEGGRERGNERNTYMAAEGKARQSEEIIWKSVKRGKERKAKDD